MLKLVKSYVREDDALDEMVSKIIFIVLAVVVVMALGWFGWNLISNKADIASEESENASNPGKGGEFSGNPFGN